MPFILGIYALCLLVALSGAMGAAIRAQARRSRAGLGARRWQQRRRQLVEFMPDLVPVVGSRREREHIKATARQWRSGVVPEEQHVCPFCGTAVRPDNLVRHYDKVHLPPASRRRRRQRHLL